MINKMCIQNKIIKSQECKWVTLDDILLMRH